MEYEQGDLVLCTVNNISGTTVFVDIEGIAKRGTIHLSEVAPGRIRNLRDYVVPKKTIVCKILKIAEDHIELSLRRVKEKEKKEIIEQHKLEKSYVSVIRSILKEKTDATLVKIKENGTIYDFMESAKKDARELEKNVGKEDTIKILEILNTQKQKIISLKKEIHLSTTVSNGLELIKKLFENVKGIEVRYLSSGKYSLKAEGKDLKTIDNLLKQHLKEIEESAKKLEIVFSVK